MGSNGNGCGVIVRVWSGRVPTGKAGEYERFLQERAVPDYSSVPGNLGGVIMRRSAGDAVEFTIVTFWRSLDDIRRFAGDDYEGAKYYPEDKDYLLELPEKVAHYQATDCWGALQRLQEEGKSG